VTAHPTRDWTVQQARNLAAERLGSMRFLLRDRDGNYSPAFDAVLQAEEINILKTAPQAPRRTRTASESSKPSATSNATSAGPERSSLPDGSWRPTSGTTTATDPIRPETSYHRTLIDNQPQFTTYRQIACDTSGSSAG
jgi:hypothetical protein